MTVSLAIYTVIGLALGALGLFVDWEKYENKNR